jgi:hypothetical protein
MREDIIIYRLSAAVRSARKLWPLRSCGGSFRFREGRLSEGTSGVAEFDLAATRADLRTACGLQVETLMRARAPLIRANLDLDQ